MVYQELLAWLEHPEHTAYRLVILQETHWHQVSDYCSGGWQCIHSSGYVEGAKPDRSSGLLIMLAKASFCDIATQELHAGRLLHVQATYKPTGLPITILALYQHVWRTQLSTSENLQLRGEILSSIKHILDHTPTRHHLVLAGDFNASLSPERACVGPAAPSPAHPNHCARLQQLVVDHQLVATNTWHAKPWQTYRSSEVSSQIDYIITRAADARGSTKHAAPLVQFPVAGWRQAGHWPIHARICLQPYRRHPPQPHKFATMCDVSALQQAVTLHTPDAQALQAAVAARLTQCHTCDPSTAQHEVNSILLEAAKEHFPSPQRVDQRVCAQPTFRANAKHTWCLYAQMKARANATLPVVWLKWRAAVRFRQASLALRAQSRQLKRQALLDQVEQASAAAGRGDQRALYMLVKRLAPRSFRGVSRMLGSDGRLLTAPQELEAIVRYGHRTFAALSDVGGLCVTAHNLVIPDAALTMELSKLGLRKAVPPHVAPVAMWRLCSTAIGQVLGRALRSHFQAPAQEPLRGDWRDCYISWIPKPAKKPLSVSDLRPIGLQCPSSKALSGVLREFLFKTPAIRYSTTAAICLHQTKGHGGRPFPRTRPLR